MSLISRLFQKTPRDRTTEILDRHLDSRFRVFPMAEQSSSLDEIRAVEEEYGVPFPPDLVAHLCGEFPGILIEATEEIWPRPKPYDVGPFWSFLYGIHTFTASPSSEDWMRLDWTAARFREDTGLHAVPVLKVIGDPDLFCVTPARALVRFNHDTNELEPVELSFFDLLDRELAELVARTDRKQQQAR